jgi:hypothetical protein
MFVEVVELMQVPQGICSSLVRFGETDCINRSLTHSLYFSGALGFVFLGVFGDREVSVPPRLGPIGFNQGPDYAIQGAPKILDDLTGSQGDFSRNALGCPKAEHPLSRIRVQLWHDSIRVAALKGEDESFQVTDMLFGPFDFDPSAV